MFASVTAVSSGQLFFPGSTFVIHFMIGMLRPTSLWDNSYIVLTASATQPRGLHLFPFTVTVYFYHDTLTLVVLHLLFVPYPFPPAASRRLDLCSVTLHLCLLV